MNNQLVYSEWFTNIFILINYLPPLSGLHKSVLIYKINQQTQLIIVIKSHFLLSKCTIESKHIFTLNGRNRFKKKKEEFSKKF